MSTHRVRCLAALIAAVWLLVSIAPQLSTAQPKPVSAKPKLRLVIDYGDGVEKHFTKLTWRKEMTVLDLLKQAEKHPRGISFKHRGKGTTGFLTQIDDVKNEGQGNNWIYHVNGKLGDRSFAIFPVKAGDRVRWKWDQYK